MHTGIGRSLHGRRARVAAALGATAVVVDLGVIWLDRYPEGIDGRWAVALTALVAHTWLSGSDLPTVGLCGPAGGWRQSVRLAALLGVVAAGCIGRRLVLGDVALKRALQSIGGA